MLERRRENLLEDLEDGRPYAVLTTGALILLVRAGALVLGLAVFIIVAIGFGYLGDLVVR